MKNPPSLRRQEGAAAVEFAIVASLLFMLVFGLIEYGFYFTSVQSLRAAAREGARVAAVRGTSSDIQKALVSGSGGTLPSGYSGYTVSPGLCPTSGPSSTQTDVTVTFTDSALPSSVQQALQIDVPFLPPINLTPTISGTFRCE